MKKGIQTVSLILIISSVLKFIDVGKNLLVAAKFGVSENADVYSAVIAIPEFILIFLGVDTLRGVINSEYSTWITQKKDSELINSFLGISSLLILTTPLIMLCIIIFREQVISLLLPGFAGEKKVLAENVLLYVIPLVFLRSFIGFFQSILNSFKQFYFPVIVPALVSLTVILFILFASTESNLLYIISSGVLVGNILVFALMAYRTLSKIGNSVPTGTLKITRKVFSNVFDNSTRKILKSSSSLLLVVIVNVLFLGSKNFLASFFGDGAISSINYASSIPGIITTLMFGSFFAYLLNRIASLQASDIENKRLLFYRTFLGLIFVIIFMVAFLLVFAKESLTILYLRGNFTEVGIELTYQPFLWEVLSMITFVLYIVPTAFFIAIKKYSILNKFGTVLYLLGILICYIFSLLFGYVGISAGVFFTQFIYGFILVYLVNKEIGGFFVYRNEILKIILVALVSMISVYLFKRFLFPEIAFNNFDFNIQLVLCSGILYSVLFINMALLLKVDYIKKLVKNYI